MIINENQLRAYSKCSEYYHRGGIDDLNFPLKVVRYSVEKTILKLLKNPERKSASDLQAIVVNSISQINRTESLLEPQINSYMNSCFMWLKNFFSIFNLENYIPVYGPTQPRVTVSKTPIEFRASAVLRSKKTQTLHIILFTPGATKHYMKNDPIALLALKTFKPLVKVHSQTKRPQVVVHCFGYGKNGNLNYHTINSNEFDENKLETITRMVKAMEIGHHYPVLPCLHKCKFKKDCY